MKKILFLLFLTSFVSFTQVSGVVAENDEISNKSEKITVKKDTSIVLKPHSKDAAEKEKSLQKQADEIPVVFGQWWFWMGLGVVLLFLKFVIFKK